MASGAWLIDTPGMRALRLVDSAAGIDEVFADVAELALACRFTDCGHDGEPGCAVEAAVAAGALAAERVRRWRKLRREDARNSASLAEVRRRARAFGKRTRSAMEDKRRLRGG
jgi:ribosome biogenesis GTPase